MTPLRSVSDQSDEARQARWAAWEALPANQARLAEARVKRDADAESMVIDIRTPPRALAAAREPQLTPAIEAVRSHAVDLLVLAGGPGVGKTVGAARWILDHITNRQNWQLSRHKADYPGCDEIDYHFSFAPLGGSRDDFQAPALWTSSAALTRIDHFSIAAIEKFQIAGRLVIDDLGAEFADVKGFFSSLLDEIIDARYSNKLPTLITTNLDAVHFRHRYGERIADRIREAGAFVDCGAESLRGRGTP